LTFPGFKGFEQDITQVKFLIRSPWRSCAAIAPRQSGIMLHATINQQPTRWPRQLASRRTENRPYGSNMSTPWQMEILAKWVNHSQNR